MGRPPYPAGTRRREQARSGGARVEVEFTASELAALDEQRGSSDRSVYLRALVARDSPSRK